MIDQDCHSHINNKTPDSFRIRPEYVSPLTCFYNIGEQYVERQGSFDNYNYPGFPPPINMVVTLMNGTDDQQQQSK